MARNAIEVNADPPDVFRVLLDPYAYPEWVVGARRIRTADLNWPEEGSSFHHSVFFAGPDRSEMLLREDSRRVVLKVFARPLAVGIVDIRLEPTLHGTKVTIEESPAPETKLRLIRSLLDPLIHLRNAEALRRFRRLVERPRPSPAA